MAFKEKEGKLKKIFKANIRNYEMCHVMSRTGTSGMSFQTDKKVPDWEQISTSLKILLASETINIYKEKLLF